MTTRLAFRNSLPDGFLDCDAHKLHRILEGPTLIELKGEVGPPLFVSILLHGNEDSGLGAIQCVLGNYLDRPLPRSLMLLVGNVEAARYGLRRLEEQPDYNRIWPGTPDHRHTAEARLVAEVHARAVDRGVIAAIDIHNNTGRNPHYSVVCNNDPHTLGLAALFSRRAVRFRGIPGSQTASFADDRVLLRNDWRQVEAPASIHTRHVHDRRAHRAAGLPLLPDGTALTSAASRMAAFHPFLPLGIRFGAPLERRCRKRAHLRRVELRC